MQYANNGSLPSYLDKNINKMTWNMKLQYLKDIAHNLRVIHDKHLIHCDLHGGNIILNERSRSTRPLICDLGLSKSVNYSSESSTSTIQGVLPYIAPEVLHSHKFTLKSDIYSFGIIMYQIADGEPPFRDYSSDNLLAMRICNGLRPEMPDSTPEEYKKLAERCCDADPNNRPMDGNELCLIIVRLLREIKVNDNKWRAIYHNENIRPLSRIEKESRYSSRLLPTGNLPKPRNSYDIDSVVQV